MRTCTQLVHDIEDGHDTRKARGELLNRAHWCDCTYHRGRVEELKECSDLHDLDLGEIS